MGTDKSFVRILGQPLIERVLARVEGLADEVVIITNRPAEFAYLGVPLFEDIVPGKAALGGIYTALSRVRGEHTLVVAVDMPFLNPDLLAYLLSLRQGYDVVAPRLEGYPQATHAVYGKACLDPIRRKIEVNRLKIVDFYDQVRARYVDEDEMRPFDPALRSFVNVNTPDELSDAQRAAGTNP
jgi:molybdopterin-guanine dinucleotide biosynthesis protein A